MRRSRRLLSLDLRAQTEVGKESFKESLQACKYVMIVNNVCLYKLLIFFFKVFKFLINNRIGCKYAIHYYKPIVLLIRDKVQI